MVIEMSRFWSPVEGCLIKKTKKLEAFAPSFLSFELGRDYFLLAGDLAVVAVALGASAGLPATVAPAGV